MEREFQSQRREGKITPFRAEAAAPSRLRGASFSRQAGKEGEAGQAGRRAPHRLVHAASVFTECPLSAGHALSTGDTAVTKRAERRSAPLRESLSWNCTREQGTRHRPRLWRVQRGAE